MACDLISVQKQNLKALICKSINTGFSCCDFYEKIKSNKQRLLGSKLGIVYFTADFLVAIDRLELLCRQSDAIRMKRSVCHAISVLLIV